MTDEEIKQAEDCALDAMLAAYAKSEHPDAQAYGGWTMYSTQAYLSATHGSRFVRNLANEAAQAYGRY